MVINVLCVMSWLDACIIEPYEGSRPGVVLVVWGPQTTVQLQALGHGVQAKPASLCSPLVSDSHDCTSCVDVSF